MVFKVCRAGLHKNDDKQLPSYEIRVIITLIRLTLAIFVLRKVTLVVAEEVYYHFRLKDYQQVPPSDGRDRRWCCPLRC